MTNIETYFGIPLHFFSRSNLNLEIMLYNLLRLYLFGFASDVIVIFRLLKAVMQSKHFHETLSVACSDGNKDVGIYNIQDDGNKSNIFTT